MFNNVQLYVYWMYLLNTRICRYTYATPTVFTVTKTGKHMKLFNLEMDSTVFKSGVFQKKNLDTNCSFLSAQRDYV